MNKREEVEILRADLRAIEKDLRTHKDRTRRIEAAARILAGAIQKLARPDIAGKAERRNL